MKNIMMSDFVVITIMVVVAIAAAVGFVILMNKIFLNDNNPTILQGRLVERGEDHIVVEYCEQHAKVSDKIVHITLQIIQSGDYVKINRYYQRVGYC